MTTVVSAQLSTSKERKAHETVANALRIVEHLEHRAGKDAEGKTGDGVGILLQISHKFFKKACKKEGFDIGGGKRIRYRHSSSSRSTRLKRTQAKKMFEIIVEKEGLELLGWRDVPDDPGGPRTQGNESACHVSCRHLSKNQQDVEKGLPFDRKLYIARRVV